MSSFSGLLFYCENKSDLISRDFIRILRTYSQGDADNYLDEERSKRLEVIEPLQPDYVDPDDDEDAVDVYHLSENSKFIAFLNDDIESHFPQNVTGKFSFCRCFIFFDTQVPLFNYDSYEMELRYCGVGIGILGYSTPSDPYYFLINAKNLPTVNLLFDLFDKHMNETPRIGYLDGC
jgi:hypothetical protein